MTGKLIIFKGPHQPFEICSGKVPLIKPGEILVRNLFTTICGSDLHTYSGLRNEPCPTVLGHEIVGRIVEISDTHDGRDHRGEKINISDIITWSIFSSDRNSAHSLEGIPQKGDNLFKYGHRLVTDEESFHGGLAEFCILKQGTAILKIPEDIPLQIAATINCAISTVAGALRLSGNVRGKKILIYGMGMLGMTASAMCKEAGADWVGAVDISSDRLALARRFGVDEAFDFSPAGMEFLKDRCRQFPKKGVDITFDMSGSPEAMESGVSLLSVGGKAVWVGAVFNTRKIQLDAEWIIRNLISIKGLHNYNYEDFLYALDFTKDNWKKYPFESVVEKAFDFDDAQDAFKYALQNKPLRVGIRI